MPKGKVKSERRCPFCKESFSFKKALVVGGEQHCPFCKRWVIWLPASFPKRSGEWITPQIAMFEPHFR
ncbi:MAG: hypothetical protein ACTSPB_04820 [Candidatus Thorarchaeota archaeon]